MIVSTSKASVTKRTCLMGRQRCVNVQSYNQSQRQGA